MLNQLNHIPAGLLELPAERLHEVLDGPTLIHLQGRREAPLFVSVLLHGNEYTGWDAMRELLARYGEQGLPRSLSLFIGNVAAAKEGARHLPGQPDYNRIWKGGDHPEEHMARQVLELMAERKPFASVDIHNNTGLNPHYGCINVLDHTFLHLATLFSRTVVYFIRPDQVQSMAFSRICPAVTLECGKVGQGAATDHARDFVDAVLHLDHFPDHPVAPHDYDLFHTVATVKVPPHRSMGFGSDEAEIRFPHDLDHLNFRELPEGAVLAQVEGEVIPVEAVDEEGRDVAERYFRIDDGLLQTRTPVMPSMLTLKEEIIRQDCLCYLMERLPAI